jgi:hypothetical protein
LPDLRRNGTSARERRSHTALTPRPASTLAALFLALSASAAGCAFDSGLTIQFGHASVVVKAAFTELQGARRTKGITRRSGQIVRIDCSISGFYTIKEATGTAFLSQRYVAHLRTSPLPKGTAFDLDCADPLIVELPTDASDLRATATASGRQWLLSVEPRLHSLPLAARKRLHAEPKTQLAVLRRPRALPAGDYRMELAFALRQARPIQMKVLFAAAVFCGGDRYLQPILPIVNNLAQAPAFRVAPSLRTTQLLIPHIAPGIATQTEKAITITCGR